MRPQGKCYLRHHGAFLLLAALLAGPQAAEAREVLLTADTRDVSLGQYVEYFEDMQGDLTLDQAIASREWKSAEPDGLRFSPGTSPLWFRFSLLNLRRAPRLFRLIISLSVFHLLLCLYGTFADWMVLSLYGTRTSVVIAVVLVASAVYSLKSGNRSARFYLIAWTGLLGGGTLWVLRVSGLLNESSLTDNAFQVGSALEAMLLSFALGDRMNLMKAEKDRAQREALEKQTVLTNSYARFVPEQVFSLLAREDVTQVRLGDATQRELTVLFSDIRSFTTLSEQMSPRENFDFLNAIMKRTGPVIREHNGFVDKFIGDAIMALFPENPEDAVRAAVKMKTNLREYNAARMARGQVKLSAGIGINTGPVILGTVGEPGRMDATVISDTVNLASRVEGLTRHYDASLLITEHTLIRLADPTKYKYRMLDRVQVKGKKQSVSIFEVFDGDEPADVERKILTQQLFEQGVQAYLSCNFSGAIRLMGLVLEKNPSDRPAELYLQRSEYFAVHGVPPDWEGVAVMDSK